MSADAQTLKPSGRVKTLAFGDIRMSEGPLPEPQGERSVGTRLLQG